MILFTFEATRWIRSLPASRLPVILYFKRSSGPDISYELYVCRLGQNNKRQNKRMALIFFITSLSPPDFSSSREFSSQYFGLAADRSSSSHHRQPQDFCAYLPFHIVVSHPALAHHRRPRGPKYRTRLVGGSSSSII